MPPLNLASNVPQYFLLSLLFSLLNRTIVLWNDKEPEEAGIWWPPKMERPGTAESVHEEVIKQPNGAQN